MRTPEQILGDSATIAVVGASRHPDKPAHGVPLQLLRHGWRVIPVNPLAEEVWGQKCYPTLAAVPERVDLVDVFRPAGDAPAVAREAVAAGARALWLQLGIVSPEAREIAEGAGLDYVEDLCVAVVRAAHGLSRLAG